MFLCRTNSRVIRSRSSYPSSYSVLSPMNNRKSKDPLPNLGPTCTSSSSIIDHKQMTEDNLDPQLHKQSHLMTQQQSLQLGSYTCEEYEQRLMPIESFTRPLAGEPYIHTYKHGRLSSIRVFPIGEPGPPPAVLSVSVAILMVYLCVADGSFLCYVFWSGALSYLQRGFWQKQHSLWGLCKLYRRSYHTPVLLSVWTKMMVH